MELVTLGTMLTHGDKLIAATVEWVQIHIGELVKNANACLQLTNSGIWTTNGEQAISPVPRAQAISSATEPWLMEQKDILLSIKSGAPTVATMATLVILIQDKEKIATATNMIENSEPKDSLYIISLFKEFKRKIKELA